MAYFGHYRWGTDPFRPLLASSETGTSPRPIARIKAKFIGENSPFPGTLIAVHAHASVAAMSLSTVETFLQNAKHQHSQTDINQSLIRAITELIREVKEIETEVHSLRRNIQMIRRI